MRKLMNLSTHPEDLARFGPQAEDLLDFLKRHGLCGAEVIHYGPWDEKKLPREAVYGVHMSFWPIWLDFWQGNEAKLLDEFEDKDTWTKYYGGQDRSILISFYVDELRSAFAMNADYCVFHVSHTSLKDCYTYDFENLSKNGQSVEELSKTVILCFSQLINEVLHILNLEIPEGFNVLFENQWWPGLSFTDPQLAKLLLEEIQYPHTGFVLDTGHLMNTNRSLRSESEALTYIRSIIESMGSLRQKIKVIHLNSSLSGAYVEEALNNPLLYDETLAFNERYFKAFSHIGKIDEHKVFKDRGIKELIQWIDPEFVVLEFMTGTLQEAEQMIAEQNSFI